MGVEPKMTFDYFLVIDSSPNNLYSSYFLLSFAPNSGGFGY